MTRLEIALIAAVSENNVIGKDGQIPWRLSEDMKRFKQLTTGHPVIMGRKTYTSIPQKFRPLPDRPNIVLSRSGFQEEGILVVGSLEEALDNVREGRPFMEGVDYGTAYIIGGEAVYGEALPVANKLEITHVNQTIEDGDAFFPEIDTSVWRESARDEREGYSFVTYLRC